jgi:hypothetical protein
MPGGTTAVAAMVDAHSHLTLPGGSHWIDRAGDPTPRLLAIAEDNARRLAGPDRQPPLRGLAAAWVGRLELWPAS